MEDEQIELSKAIVDEIITATGISKNRFTRTFFWLLFHKITNHLADLLTQFGQIVESEGLPEGSKWLQMNFCRSMRTRGSENIPKQGPLMVITNHPGAYDGLVVFSNLRRNDILWIAHDIPGIRLIKKVQKHILYASVKDHSEHFLVMRQAIRHLNSGGTLVYFASGGRDPDPAVYAGAETAIDHWLGTFETFFKRVPGLKIQSAVVSHVISPVWVNHPVTRLRRDEYWKMILSEFGQVIFQLANPGKLMLSPAISFGEPFTEVEIRQEAGGESLQQAIIKRAQSLLRDHCLYYKELDTITNE